MKMPAMAAVSAQTEFVRFESKRTEQDEHTDNRVLLPTYTTSLVLNSLL